MSTLEACIAQYEDEERRLIFRTFDQLDAWKLGQLITVQAITAGHQVLIEIRRPTMVLFRAALPGSAPDQESWAERKAAVVLRLESSSAVIAARMKLRGIDPTAIGWLDHRYALTGGSFPVRVHGVGVVATVTASGLSSEGDHELVVSGLEKYLASTQQGTDS
jgi:uncharacterized protein (UPF0303 family)